MRRPSFLTSVIAAVALALTAPRQLRAQTSSAPQASTAPSSAAPTSAAPDTHPESASTVQEAQLHTQRALEHFRAHQYPEAIHEFELANRAAPSADFWYNIARSHELLSHYDEAIDYYRRYLRDKVDPPDRADVERRIAELGRLAEQQRTAARRQTSQATVRFEMAGVPSGARVFLGDREVGRAPLTAPLQVAPATYPIRVQADGYQEWRGQVRVRRGEAALAFVSLQPETRYATRSGGHLVSYILAGLTVAAFGTGAVFGVLSRGEAACMGTGACARQDEAVRADVLFGVGTGLLLTTAIVWFIESGSSHTERLAPASRAPRASR